MALFGPLRVLTVLDMFPVGSSAPTSELCLRIREAVAAPLPREVGYAARRSLFNVLGTTIGAARTPAVEALFATAREQGGEGAVVVPGRDETLDSHWGALAVGTAGHLDDFDDTHLETVIHPAASTLATVLALQPEIEVDGDRYLRAFAIGCEFQLRIGGAISPNHYDRGWHITGTCGVFGAVVTAALLFDLPADRLEHGLALAATMIVGHREGFGSMTKPFHPGKAAANGVLAARLARAGATAFPDPLGEKGMLSILSDGVERRWLTAGWDRDWELEKNTFKPYPCGIVAHPAIDAATEASARVADPAAIIEVEIVCHPLVPELMGRRQPADGLQARFSVHHAAAVALIDGRVGLEQFADERAVAPEVERLRGLITLVPTAGCARDEATIRVVRDGTEPVSVHIEHARGSHDRPLTDEELFEKVDRLVRPVLGRGVAHDIHGAVGRLAGAPGLDELITRIRPSIGRETRR